MKYAQLKGLFFAVSLFFTAAAGAAQLEGRVFDVLDGNTLYVLDGLDTPYVVRLVNAPADNGDARAAQQRLVDLTFHKHVHVVWQQVDASGRLLARVYMTGPDIVCYDALCPTRVEIGSVQTAP